MMFKSVALYRFRMASLGALIVSLLVFAGPSARAGIVSVSGNGDILDPSVTPTGATPNFFNDPGESPKVHGWNEKQGVVLNRDVYVDIVNSGTYNSISDLGTFNQYKIAQGTAVESHMFYFDPLQSREVRQVTFTFDQNILGVIVESDRFFNPTGGNTDYFVASDFLGNPLTTYPASHFNNRGLELGSPDTISVSISGRSIRFDILGASNPGDQVRVITAVPEPASLLSAALGVIAGLGYLRRRRSAA